MKVSALKALLVISCIAVVGTVSVPDPKLCREYCQGIFSRLSTYGVSAQGESCDTVDASKFPSSLSQPDMQDGPTLVQSAKDLGFQCGVGKSGQCDHGNGSQGDKDFSGYGSNGGGKRSIDDNGYDSVGAGDEKDKGDHGSGDSGSGSIGGGDKGGNGGNGSGSIGGGGKGNGCLISVNIGGKGSSYDAGDNGNGSAGGGSKGNGDLKSVNAGGGSKGSGDLISINAGGNGGGHNNSDGSAGGGNRGNGDQISVNVGGSGGNHNNEYGSIDGGSKGIGNLVSVNTGGGERRWTQLWCPCQSIIGVTTEIHEVAINALTLAMKTDAIEKIVVAYFLCVHAIQVFSKKNDY
ncbi:hypothetical protein K493DRAFT_296714 [Basidiobolus meristosporus CBS 931.73]|uniref:Uncharacterized protein n=1 Tax=Basidiobolus meristosporus CBS 931.73 TaxID=1314790 RepID=A0A1Y1Z4Y1_9FUNG|nr:hypothetical protein K493DRAFT_296714 [Basidiobolus meristosporus CBS 931.73]|eukprot:ORY05027.1 hypothetical protein K493DRAFT_296714 [Basidiobolus meristosporus CBS 931.73]